MTEGVEKKEVARIECPTTERGLALRSLDEIARVAQYFVAGRFAPKGDDVPAVVSKILFGRELGLSAAQSLTALCSINGRCSLYGDGLLAVLKASGQLVGRPKSEKVGTRGQDNYGVRVTLVRRGEDEPYVYEFTVADAKLARLWGKDGPWTQYPDRMLYWKALSWAAREGFSDILRGVSVYEEVADVVEPQGYDVATKPAPQTVRALPALAKLVVGPPPQEPAPVVTLWDQWRDVLARLTPELLGEIMQRVGRNPMQSLSPADPAELISQAIAAAHAALEEVADDQ
jgi:hypothetical protein